MNIYDEALKLHEKNHGKLTIEVKVPCDNAQDLSLAYTPGVAEPCRRIAKNAEDSYVYTDRGNTVAVVTDGTAVLGLGDIGPEAALPVMEGKALLMKRFAGIDAWPICLDTKDPEEIIKICKMIAPGFGAINLEDISAPRCVEIERRLIKECSIPVFHDDQHGTSIVVLAALINCLKLLHKKPEELRAVISGCGAAGSSIIRMMHQYGFTHINAFDKDGFVDPEKKDSYDSLKQELLQSVNLDGVHYETLSDAMKDADIFIGVSAPGIVTEDMVRSMHPQSIVFAMANPEPEISYEAAVNAGAYIIGTGRSDHPNQINNLLAFPGLFRGALDSKAAKITENMTMAVSNAIASLVSEEELSRTYIVPSAFDERVVPAVAAAVSEACIKEGVQRPCGKGGSETAQ